MSDLLEKFICVRFVRMQGVDLDQFQFDYDLTWSGVFLNPDGTVYGRYGARDARDPMSLNSMKGLETMLTRVLEVHANYPKNKKELKAKRGDKAPYARVEDIPADLIQNPLKSPNAKQACIHCHMLHDAEQELAVKAKVYAPEKFFRYPLPSSIGLTMDVDAGTTVTEVAADSEAAKAGMLAGDVITHLDGQAILSIADIQWVLHHVADKGDRLECVVQRDGQESKHRIVLKKEWKPESFSWRPSMFSMPPSPGLWVEETSAARRAEAKVPDDQMCVEVKGLFKPAVQRSGLRKGDLIVSIDGDRTRRGEREFHTWLRLHAWKPKSKVELGVWRSGKLETVTITF